MLKMSFENSKKMANALIAVRLRHRRLPGGRRQQPPDDRLHRGTAALHRPGEDLHRDVRHVRGHGSGRARPDRDPRAPSTTSWPSPLPLLRRHRLLPDRHVDRDHPGRLAPHPGQRRPRSRLHDPRRGLHRRRRDPAGRGPVHVRRPATSSTPGPAARPTRRRGSSSSAPTTCARTSTARASTSRSAQVTEGLEVLDADHRHAAPEGNGAPSEPVTVNTVTIEEA